MPLFDYKCQACLWTAELIRPQSDEDDEEECPRCGGRFFRQFSGTTNKPVFKGTGFYETDFK
jgi:putative FmdB family regulatory protein